MDVAAKMVALDSVGTKRMYPGESGKTDCMRAVAPQLGGTCVQSPLGSATEAALPASRRLREGSSGVTYIMIEMDHPLR